MFALLLACGSTVFLCMHCVRCARHPSQAQASVQRCCKPAKLSSCSYMETWSKVLYGKREKCDAMEPVDGVLATAAS
jgi:hypothetical protein